MFSIESNVLFLLALVHLMSFGWVLLRALFGLTMGWFVVSFRWCVCIVYLNDSWWSIGHSELSIISTPFWVSLAFSVSFYKTVGMSSCPSLWIAVVVLVGVLSTGHVLYFFSGSLSLFFTWEWFHGVRNFPIWDILFVCSCLLEFVLKGIGEIVFVHWVRPCPS